MRNRKVLLTCMLVVGVAAPVHAASGISNVDAAWVKAIKANDVEALTACYAPDAVGWFPGSPMAKGKQAIHDSYQAWLSGVTIQDAKITELGSRTNGNESIGWGTWSVTSTPKNGGSPSVANGRYTEVAKKVNGKWLYEVDHASEDPAPAGK
jgi:uncharacterized protein (TIGR02246 family)